MPEMSIQKIARPHIRMGNATTVTSSGEITKSIYFGYLHENGTTHLKRYYLDRDVEEVKESTLVKYTVEPFEAENASIATAILERKIKVYLTMEENNG